MNYFATPVSSDEPYDNYRKTVETGVDFNKIKTFGLPNYTEINNNTIRLWGIRTYKKTTWSKVNEGDILFFYSKKHIISYCKILKTHQSIAVAEQLWGSFENAHYPKYTWPLLLILDKPKECKIPFVKFNKIIGYAESYSLRSFFKLSDTFAKYIETEYKTVEKFAISESAK